MAAQRKELFAAQDAEDKIAGSEEVGKYTELAANGGTGRDDADMYRLGRVQELKVSCSLFQYFADLSNRVAEKFSRPGRAGFDEHGLNHMEWHIGVGDAALALMTVNRGVLTRVLYSSLSFAYLNGGRAVISPLCRG